MQRNEMIALVAGASVGVGGGMLGAFLAWTAGGAVARCVLDPLGDQYIELSPPTLPAARHGAPQASRNSTSMASPAGVPSLPNAREAVTSTQAAWR
ncbi:MAG TPA: hypothetical protein VGS80_01315 [Ktedonobacterales bacterium]|nr:hypothetical protein [Ktedonobacterales bacterium]